MPIQRDPSSSPLNDEHCACLDAVIESVAKTRELIGRCKECGLDVSRAEADNEAQGALAAAIKAKFFPGRA